MRQVRVSITYSLLRVILSVFYGIERLTHNFTVDPLELL